MERVGNAAILPADPLITDHWSPFSRRGGRAVDCAGLENRKAERPREFESHPLRFVDYQALISESSLSITPPHKCGQRLGRIRHEIIIVTAPRLPDTSKRTRYPNSLQFLGGTGTRRVFSFRARPRLLSLRRFFPFGPLAACHAPLNQILFFISGEASRGAARRRDLKKEK